MPGPPPGDLLLGQTKALMRSETETLSEWVATYGPAIRVVGPIGLERVLFLRPEALHQTLVKDWLDYPRVCRLPWSYLQKLIYISASLSAPYSGFNYWLWAAHCDGR